jgi:hypothetical protein
VDQSVVCAGADRGFESQLRNERRCEMSFQAEFIEKLKWSIYDWIGAISVDELASNHCLRLHIESLFKKLAAFKSLEAV